MTTTSTIPQALPPVALDLDESARAVLQSARQVVADLSNESDLANRVRAAADAVVENNITIVFGGHWNAGKSTLVNALLERDLLPVSDRTETGVACRIRAGAADEAIVRRKDLSIAIPCMKQAIADEVSITGGGREPRTKIEAVEILDLTLARASLPPNVCWIDTPGLNDASDADERLRREADRADQLLWVINPDQPLSEVEQRFLADHTSRHGADSVSLIINVRTRTDPKLDWHRFDDEGWPALRKKIDRFWSDVGAPAAARPPQFIVSGAHLLDHFGAATLRAFLCGADGRLAARVMSGRIRALLAATAKASSEMRLRAERRRTAQVDRERKLALFRPRATARLLEIVGEVREALRAIGAQLARSKTASTAQSELALGAQLRAEMHRLVVARWNDIVAALVDAAAHAGIAPPSAATLERVAPALTIPAISIPPPAVAPTGGCANGLWACAAPLALFCLLIAMAKDSPGPVIFGVLVCVVVAAIVSGRAGEERARDLPRRVDEGILAAAAVHATQIPATIDELVNSQGPQTASPGAS